MNTTSNKFNLSIEYCVPCDYSSQALLAATSIIKNFQHSIDRLVLIPGTKGIFDVKINDELVFSKQQIKRFPNEGELINIIENKHAI